MKRYTAEADEAAKRAAVTAVSKSLEFVGLAPHVAEHVAAQTVQAAHLRVAQAIGPLAATDTAA
jgi:hypothetical protein